MEVAVPVWVLSKGQPVDALRADDFLLFDRGKRQKIIGFEVIERQGPAANSLSAEGMPEASSQTHPLPGARRNMLLLFDLHRLRGSLAARTVAGVRRQLAVPMIAGDRWGIAIHGITISGDRNKSARLVVGFTADRARLHRGLDAVQALLDRRPRQAAAILETLAGGAVSELLRSGRSEAAFAGLSRPAALTLLATGARRDAETGRFESGVPLGWLGVEAPDRIPRDAAEGLLFKSARIRVSDGSAESLLRWFTLAMADLVTFLRDVPGENHLLLLSPGGYGPLADSFTTGRMKPMLAAFRRYGWTFEAIDVNGSGFHAADMFYMANETGGLLVENVPSIDDCFARIREQTRVTYLLTFRPSRLKTNGAYHKLEVKLRERSRATRVRFRAGYYAPSGRGTTDTLEARLDAMEAVLGDAEIRRFDVEVAFAEPIPTRDGRWRVKVRIAVDGAGLLAGHQQSALDVAIEGYALDAAGGVADLFVENATFDLDSVGWLAGNRLRLARELVLDEGVYRLRVRVQNEQTGAASLTSTPLRLPAAPR